MYINIILRKFAPFLRSLKKVILIFFRTTSTCRIRLSLSLMAIAIQHIHACILTLLLSLPYDGMHQHQHAIGVRTQDIVIIMWLAFVLKIYYIIIKCLKMNCAQHQYTTWIIILH